MGGERRARRRRRRHRRVRRLPQCPSSRASPSPTSSARCVPCYVNIVGVIEPLTRTESHCYRARHSFGGHVVRRGATGAKTVATPKPKAAAKPKLSADEVFLLRVELEEADPVEWRLVAMRASATLAVP